VSTRRIVVTGAHSYLGAHTIAALLSRREYEIAALITPWAKEESLHAESQSLSYHRADLSKPLDRGLREVIATADAVLHYGWIRGTDAEQVLAANLAVIESLVEPLVDKDRFFFVSSASASQDAKSIYGRTKWMAAERVRAFGGSVLVCGLVVAEEPKGPYQLLHRTVARFPIAIRLAPCEVKVYPVALDALMDEVLCALGRDLQPGTYALFSGGVGFNRFIEGIEAAQRRRRIPLRLSPTTILSLAAWGKRTRLLPGLVADKLLSFFHKDEAYLDGLPRP
jgi:nucleoside-diphosphate-sugar epimerase